MYVYTACVDVISDGSLFYTMCDNDYSLSLHVCILCMYVLDILSAINESESQGMH